MEVLFPGQHFHTMELDKTMEVGFSNLFLQYFQHIQSTLWKRSNFSSVSQSCAVAKSDNFWRATGQSNLPDKGWPQQKFPKFDFRIHTTPLWPMEQSSSLVFQFGFPVARQNVLLAHDCETYCFRPAWPETHRAGDFRVYCTSQEMTSSCRNSHVVASF